MKRFAISLLTLLMAAAVIAPAVQATGDPLTDDLSLQQMLNDIRDAGHGD